MAGSGRLDGSLQRRRSSIVVLGVSLNEIQQTDEADDAAIIDRVMGGDTQAFAELVVRYQGRVWCLLRNLLPGHVSVEDVAQDVYVSAFVHLGSFDARRGRFSTWLLTIAKNHGINARRRLVPLPVAQLPVAPDRATPSEELECHRTMQKLDAALAALPEEQRSTFIFGELLDLPTEQIAAIEAVSPSTIRSRLSRARAALLAVLDDAESER